MGQIDRERAKRLLRLLQMRTEARGATAAEAAASAELAAKLIDRYGLDASDSETAEDGVTMDQRRFPRWANVLAWSICDRFSVEGKYITQRGQASRVVFLGHEHRVSVACWLFRAVATDLRKAAAADSQRCGVSGAAKTAFQGEFLLAAAWEVYRRLNSDWRAKLAGPLAKQAEREAQQQSKPARSRKVARRRNRSDNMASVLGLLAGRQVNLQTNALSSDGTVQPPLCLDHQPSRPKVQSALFT